MIKLRCQACGTFSFHLIKTRWWKNKEETLYLCETCNGYNKEAARRAE